MKRKSLFKLTLDRIINIFKANDRHYMLLKYVKNIFLFLNYPILF